MFIGGPRLPFDLTVQFAGALAIYRLHRIRAEYNSAIPGGPVRGRACNLRSSPITTKLPSNVGRVADPPWINMGLSASTCLIHDL